MKANVGRVDTSEILRTVPPDQSFLFFENIDKYTGRVATNLNDFCKVMKTVDAKSVTFHLARGDYERWMRESLHDVQLARRLKRIRESYSEEALRKSILQAARSHLEELRAKKLRKIKSPHRKEKLKKSPRRKKKNLRKKEKSKTAKTRKRGIKKTARL